VVCAISRMIGYLNKKIHTKKNIPTYIGRHRDIWEQKKEKIYFIMRRKSLL
jgi:hypothetical protein